MKLHSDINKLPCYKLCEQNCHCFLFTVLDNYNASVGCLLLVWCNALDTIKYTVDYPCVEDLVCGISVHNSPSPLISDT